MTKSHPRPAALITGAAIRLGKHIALGLAAEGYDIILIGHDGHEEVVGTMGEAPEAITLVEDPASAVDLEVENPDKLVWLSQTTLSVDETMQTVNTLQGRFPNLMSPPSDDICYATQNRQVAVKEIARDSDVVIVVGSGNSSNSVRLVEVALEAGAGSSYRVDSAHELDPTWFDGATTVGVTSGASVPDVLVNDVLDSLKDLGFGTALGRELDVPLKLTGLVEQLLIEARAAHGGDAWTPQVIAMMERACGVELRAEGFDAVID